MTTMAWGLSACLNHTITCFVGKTRREKNGPMKLSPKQQTPHPFSLKAGGIFVAQRLRTGNTLQTVPRVSRVTQLCTVYFWISKLLSRTKCSGHACCVQKQAEFYNVKRNLTICRKYKLTQATNTPKSSSEGRTLLEAIHRSCFMPKNKVTSTASLVSLSGDNPEPSALCLCRVKQRNGLPLWLSW